MLQHADMSIREFKESDLPAVKALINHTIDVCYVRIYPQEAVQFFKDWHSSERILNDARRGHVIVLEKDGRVVGTGTLVGDEIRRVFVDPSLQKQGFGRVIMRRLEEKAGSLGAAAVKLDASLPSKRFYDLLGYATLEETFIEVASNKRLDYYKMEKFLAGRGYMLEIAEAETAQEVGSVRSLLMEYAESLDFDLGFQHFEDELKNLPGDYAQPKGCLLFAAYQGRPTGCVALRPLDDDDDDVCEMKRLYVRPESRGLGIGRALAEAIVEKARAAGYKRMRLDTVPAMKAARRLYQSLGFEQISAYRYNPIEGAEFMELRLL